MIKYLRTIAKRLPPWFRLVWRRLSFTMLLIAAVFLAGGVVGAYRNPLGAFIRQNGIGEAALKFVPIFGPTLAFIAFLWQVARARYTQRVDLILKLSERFDRPDMRTARAKAAAALLSSRETDEDAVDTVLDFFEEVGFLFQQGAIDVASVYEFFEYWIVPYYQATTQYRETERDETNCSDLYSNMRRLALALTDLALAKTGKDTERSDDEIDRFLAAESRLAATQIKAVRHSDE